MVAIFKGADVEYRGTDVESVIEVLAGVAALGYAVGVASGRTQPPSRGDRAADGSRIVRRLRNPSVTTASLAGVATHLPGLFYLVALNAIVAEGRSLIAGVLDVLLFNAIWFGAAIASVVIFLLRPGAARSGLARIDRWAGRHARSITTLVFAAVGSYLAIKGTTGLAG